MPLGSALLQVESATHPSDDPSSTGALTVDDTINWKPDPFGVHELRFFSADGKPTLLVMDGGKRSYDKPPTDRTESHPDGAQLESDPMTDGHPSPVVTQPALLA